MKPVDAVIVPTARYNSTDYAAALAEELRADLFVIRDRKIADARNKGLLAAKACGWTRIMFLDDDIRMSADQVADAAKACSQVAAFRVTDFPDNSVVRHAERLTGVNVPVYPSGGAMLLNMRTVPEERLFPEIYNEDWLFMHGLDVAVCGEVRQLPYDPFVPGRAAREEFGDVIAEAVRDREISDDPGFWAAKIAERDVFLRGLNVSGAAGLSVAEARQALTAVNADKVICFLRSWCMPR